MADPTFVRLPMEGIVTSLGTVSLPKIRVRFRQDKELAGWSAPYVALVDTGAWTTLVRQELTELLGLEELLEAAEPITFRGVDGTEHPGSKVSIDLLLGPTDPDKCIAVAGATVCFTTLNLPYPILLGQRDVLERLELNQRNQQPAPEFVLRKP